MSFGMAFFALSVGLTVAGVKPADLRQISLRPSAIRHTYYYTQARVVRYYENVRIVYEVESRVREIKRNVAPAEPGPRESRPPKPKDDKNDTTQQPEQKQERNYSQTDNHLILAALLLGPSPCLPLSDLPVVSVTTVQEVRMNCATHSDTAAVAFCRTCGKPLCNQCTRDVRGVIYCEACLAARMEGASSVPAAGFVPPRRRVYPTGHQPFADRTATPGSIPAPIPESPEFLRDSFPLGSAPYMPASTPRDWRTWSSWCC